MGRGQACRASQNATHDSNAMHPRTEELLEYLNTQHERIRVAVDRVPRAQRERKVVPDGWSIAEVLEHLSIVERRIDRLFQSKIAEARANGLGGERDQSPIVGTVDMDRVLDRTRRITAGEGALPKGNLSADEAWRAFEIARGALCDTVRDCDGLAKTRSRSIPRPRPDQPVSVDRVRRRSRGAARGADHRDWRSVG